MRVFILHVCGAVKVDLAELDHRRFGARDHQMRASLSFVVRQLRLGQIQAGREGRALDELCQLPRDLGRHRHGELDGLGSGHWHLLLMPRAGIPGCPRCVGCGRTVGWPRRPVRVTYWRMAPPMASIPSGRTRGLCRRSWLVPQIIDFRKDFRVTNQAFPRYGSQPAVRTQRHIVCGLLDTSCQ